MVLSIASCVSLCFVYLLRWSVLFLVLHIRWLIWRTHRTQRQLFLLMAMSYHSSRTHSRTSQGKRRVRWSLEESSWRLPRFSPRGWGPVQSTHLPPSVKCSNLMHWCCSPKPAWDSKPRVFYRGLVMEALCLHDQPWLLKFQTPRRKTGVHYKSRCLYKESRQAGAAGCSAPGRWNSLISKKHRHNSKSQFSDARQGPPYEQAFLKSNDSPAARVQSDLWWIIF